MTWKEAGALCLSLAWCLGARGDAPPGRYIITAETVRDNRTQLTWQRAVAPSVYSWDAAKSYCTGLALAGQSGWRLPTRRELLSIADRTRSTPAIDAVAFANTPADLFWTASPYAGKPGDAWYVYFDVGLSGSSGTASTYRVRCVR